MLARLTLRLTLAAGTLIACGALGAAAAHAQGYASVPLSTPAGGVVGTATLPLVDGGLQVTVSVQNRAPNAAYTLCVTDPATAQRMGACPTTGDATTFATDASGSGQGSVTALTGLPTLAVIITNNANPSDSAEGLLAVSVGICPESP